MTTPPIPSPCISVCRIDRSTGLCEGCLRSLEEIGAWRDAGDDERLAILDRLKARRRSLGRTSAADSRPRRRDRGRRTPGGDGLPLPTAGD